MIQRRALIIAPLYDGQWLPQLVGRPIVCSRLKSCLEHRGQYDVKTYDGIIKQANLRQVLDDFFKAEGHLLLYFYGHGCLRSFDQGVFATSEARPYDEGIPMSEVCHLASHSPASEIVLLFDCCHAGAAFPVNRPALEILVNQLSSSVGRDLLAACASHQQGWEARNEDEQMLGAFSYHILNGLEGAAFRTEKGEIRGSLLGAYVTGIFQSWQQDPIAQTHETGARRCVITFGFPVDNHPLEPKFPFQKREALIIGVPFKPSMMFVGRAAELEHLKTTLLNAAKSIAVSATVEGLGGIGKTELIIQLIYAQEIISYYDTIIWLDASGPLLPQWNKIAVDLKLTNLSDRQDIEPSYLIHLVAEALRHRGSTLIVLDNASDWDTLEVLIPSGFPLIVTTRTHGFGGNRFIHTELTVLSSDSAKDFLTQMVPDLRDDTALDRLVEGLGGHALGLELAGWNIKYLGLTASEYLERLREHQVDTKQALDATRYGAAIDACLAITWNGLRLDSSRALWRRAALFAPLSAHRDLLKVSFLGTKELRYLLRELNWGDDLDWSELYEGVPQDFTAAYAELRACHVLSRVEGYNGERWAMHRLVRDYGKLRIRPVEVLSHVAALSEWIRQPNLPLEPEIPHIVAAILESARERFSTRLGTARDIFRTRTVLRASKSIDELTFLNSRYISRFVGNELSDPKAINIILEAITDINEDVRVEAIRLLENIGPLPEVIKGLTNCLSDPDVKVRETAKIVIAQHGSEQIIQILATLIRDTKEQRTKLIGIKTLGLIGHKADPVLENFLGDSNIEIRLEAALLLCEHGNPSGIPYLTKENLQNSSTESIRIINALGNTRHTDAVPFLKQCLEIPSLIHSCVHSLSNINDPVVHALLFDLLRKGDDQVKYETARAIEKLKIKNGIETIISVLSAQSIENQMTGKFPSLAVEIAAQNEFSVPVEILSRLIERVSDRSKRRTWISLLSKHNNPQAIEALSKLLNDSDSDTRNQALQSLISIGIRSELIIPLLHEISQTHSDNNIRSQAIKALNKFDPKKANSPQKVIESVDWLTKTRDEWTIDDKKSYAIAKAAFRKGEGTDPDVLINNIQNNIETLQPNHQIATQTWMVKFRDLWGRVYSFLKSKDSS